MSCVIAQRFILRVYGIVRQPFSKGFGLVIGEINATTHIGILVLIC